MKKYKTILSYTMAVGIQGLSNLAWLKFAVTPKGGYLVLAVFLSVLCVVIMADWLKGGE